MDTLLELPNVDTMKRLANEEISVDDACDQLFRYLLALHGEKAHKGKIEYVQPRPDTNKVFIGTDGKRKTPVLQFVIPLTSQRLYPAHRINFEITKVQAHKGMLTQTPTPKDDPTLHMIARQCDLTLDQMADAIKSVAKLIDDDGNKGMGTGRLNREDVGVNVGWLSNDYPEAWQGIIFFNEERKVWQCRKNPFWLKTWCERYADPGSDCAVLAAKEVQQKVLAAKDQADDAKLPKREFDRCVHGDWERLTTRQVAERFLYASMMRIREHTLFMEHRSSAEYELRQQLGNYGFMSGFASLVWEEQQGIMWSELNYRSNSGDDEATRYLHNNKWFDEMIAAEARHAINSGANQPPPYFSQPNEVKS